VIEILNFVAIGVMSGGLYALLAIGLNLIFGVMRVINVAHGDMLTVGAYAAVLFSLAVSANPVAASSVAVVVVIILGLIIARCLVIPLLGQGAAGDKAAAGEKQGLVMMLGTSMFLSNAILAAFGPDFQIVPRFVGGVIEIGDVFLEGQRLLILGASIAATLLLAGFLRFTALGLAVRAVAENPDAAQASGIAVRRIHLLTFAIGAAMAGVAGALVAPVTYAYPAMGFPFTLYAFMVVVIGGLGSLPGALIGGYILGIAESLAVLWAPTGYNAMVGPLMMLLVLVLRPQGLLGRRSDRA